MSNYAKDERRAGILILEEKHCIPFWKTWIISVKAENRHSQSTLLPCTHAKWKWGWHTTKDTEKTVGSTALPLKTVLSWSTCLLIQEHVKQDASSRNVCSCRRRPDTLQRPGSHGGVTGEPQRQVSLNDRRKTVNCMKIAMTPNLRKQNLGGWKNESWKASQLLLEQNVGGRWRMCSFVEA